MATRSLFALVRSRETRSVVLRGTMFGVYAQTVALHMIEETARHAGHADIIRETIDGTRG